MKNILILVLTAVVVWESAVIVRIENERYALLVGMCRNTMDPLLPPDMKCLSTVKTRTHWVWHLYYALLD